MSGWGRGGEKRVKLEDELETLSLDEVEVLVLDNLSREQCVFCSSNLDGASVTRTPYLTFMIHRVECEKCGNTLLKFYSSLGALVRADCGEGTRYAPKGEILGVSGGVRRFGPYYKISGILSNGISRINAASPIPTSRDYKKESKVGRPRKYDYRELDSRIWAFLATAYRTKFGYDTESVWRKVNYAYGSGYSRRLILARLKDMELRGLVIRERRVYGAAHKAFWNQAPMGDLPHRTFSFPHTGKFMDRELFPEGPGDFWDHWRRARARERYAKRRKGDTIP